MIGWGRIEGVFGILHRTAELVRTHAGIPALQLGIPAVGRAVLSEIVVVTVSQIGVVGNVKELCNLLVSEDVPISTWSVRERM